MKCAVCLMSLNVPQLNLDVFIPLIGLLSYNGSALADADNEDENQNFPESSLHSISQSSIYGSPLMLPSLVNHITPFPLN